MQRPVYDPCTGHTLGYTSGVSNRIDFIVFTALALARNARIASAVLATAIPSVCPSVCVSVTRRYCVKTTARSTMQFPPLDSKMCLVS